MICMNCGKDVPDDSAFCPYCGKDPAAKSPKRRGGFLKILFPTVVIAAVAAVGVVAVSYKPTIDLNSYITITATGYDTLGTLDVEFDTEKLENDYGKRFADSMKKALEAADSGSSGKNSIDIEELTADLPDADEATTFELLCANGTADKTDNLSNGDVVTYTWDADDALSEKFFGVKLAYSDISYTVSGLEEIQLFDAFDGVTVEFTGIAPHGKATINNISGTDLNYTLDKSSDLSNGDTVTLKVNSEQKDFTDCIEKYGGVPAETEKTIPVQGLSEYITSADSLTDSVLQSLKNQAEDVLNAYIANRGEINSESFTGIEYLGNYILSRKQETVIFEMNRVILAYKVNVHNHFENYANEVYDADNSFYWYIAFKSVIKDGDGNISSGLNSYIVPSHDYRVESNVLTKEGHDDTAFWRYNGYETLDSMYSDAVTRNIEDYNHQDNVES